MSPIRTSSLDVIGGENWPIHTVVADSLAGSSLQRWFWWSTKKATRCVGLCATTLDHVRFTQSPARTDVALTDSDGANVDVVIDANKIIDIEAAALADTTREHEHDPFVPTSR